MCCAVLNLANVLPLSLQQASGQTSTLLVVPDSVLNLEGKICSTNALQLELLVQAADDLEGKILENTNANIAM